MDKLYTLNSLTPANPTVDPKVEGRKPKPTLSNPHTMKAEIARHAFDLPETFAPLPRIFCGHFKAAFQFPCHTPSSFSICFSIVASQLNFLIP